MNKKISNYILITSLVLTSISGCASNSQQNKVAVQVTQRITELKKEKKTFKNEDDRNKKLNVLKKIVKSEKKYTKDDESKKAYKNSLKEMRQYFTDDYDKRLSDNKIDDLDSITDASQINEKKDNLTALRNDLDKEYKYTLKSKKIYNSYLNNLDEIEKNYDEKISNITQVEEENSQNNSVIQQTSNTYSNEFFTLTFPDSWVNECSVREDTSQTRTIDGRTYLRVFECRHDPEDVTRGGITMIYVEDMSDYGKDPQHNLWFYRTLLPDEGNGMETAGTSSSGWDVFYKDVAGIGIIVEGGITISVN